MRKLLLLWWRLYRARKMKSKGQIMARPATAEEVANLEDNGRLVETFWRLKYRSSMVRVKVYRLIEKDEYGAGRVMIYENIERKLFVAGGYCSGWDGFAAEKRLLDLSDAWNVVNRLWHPVLVESERWDIEGAASIDAAADKASSHRQDLFARMRRLASAANEPAIPQEEIDPVSAVEGQGDDAMVDSTESAHLDEDERGPNDEQGEYLRQALDHLRKIAGTTDICWKALGLTPAGREFHIFVMDGKEEHWAPLRLLNFWPGRGRPARLSDVYQ